MTDHTRPAGFNAGVYRLRDRAANLLYVGVGSFPNARLRSHAKTKDWWGDVDQTRTTVEWFRTYEDALAAERLAIKTEKPLHNLTYSTTRPHWSVGRPAPREVAATAGFIPVEDFRKNLSEYVSRTKARDERFVVSRHGAPAVALVSYEFLLRAEDAMQDAVEMDE